MPKASSPTPTQLARYFEVSRDLLCVVTPGGVFGALNGRWSEVLGWSAEELTSRPFATFLHPQDRESTAAHIGRLKAGQPSIRFENRYRCRDGSYRQFEWASVADPDGTIYGAARDVTEPRAAQAEARRLSDVFEAVLTTAADPIVVIDESGIIEIANTATVDLFGHAEAELIGQNVSMLMPEPYRSAHDGFIANYLATGDRKIIGIGREVRAVTAEGVTFPIHLSVSEVDLGHQRLFTGVIRDLSDLHDAARALRRANDGLEAKVAERTEALEESLADLARSNRDLEQFAYVASHDLKAPLRNVRQGLELLDEHLQAIAGGVFDDEAEELRGLVLGAVDRMEDLIQGLLTYSRVGRGADKDCFSDVDLAAVASEAIERLAAESAEAGAIIEVAEDLPTVRGDELQLVQLIQNLIQNAVKYRAEDRPPVITIEDASDAANWGLAIGDNGIGIDEAHHGKVFELFRRAHPGYEGVGLGLTICQRIVERHRGSIAVASSPGEGSTFTITIPRPDDRTAAAASDTDGTVEREVADAT